MTKKDLIEHLREQNSLLDKALDKAINTIAISDKMINHLDRKNSMLLDECVILKQTVKKLVSV